MIWSDQAFGYGSPLGVLYFYKRGGLAPKKVTDAEVNGTNLADDREGKNSLRFVENCGKMPGFRLVPFISDTHFHAQGRLARLIPIMMDLKKAVGFGLDENTSLFY